MSNQPLRVGLVGANPNQSWASMSHLPAIAALPAVELVAVATSRPETARAAGEAFGVDEYYASAAELAHSENVDIVSVVVKVPYHAEIVEAALDAGKHVLCEWPRALIAFSMAAITVGFLVAAASLQISARETLGAGDAGVCAPIELAFARAE